MLDGKTALVTGSSQGIGLGIAAAFARHGARVVVTSEHAFEDCPALKAVFDSSRMTYVRADLRDEDGPSRLVEAADAALGRIDIVVNNVGTWREPDFLSLTRAHFDDILRLNVWAALAVTRDVVKLGIQRGRGGRILFTTSLNGTRSEPAHTLYDTSKGGINALTRQLAVELAPHGFTTAAVAPGFVETPLTDYGLRSDPVVRQAIIDQIPVRRIATVDDIVGWFVFLASDQAGYATGAIITVDGGLDAQQMGLRPISAVERT